MHTQNHCITLSDGDSGVKYAEDCDVIVNFTISFNPQTYFGDDSPADIVIESVIAKNDYLLYFAEEDEPDAIHVKAGEDVLKYVSDSRYDLTNLLCNIEEQYVNQLHDDGRIYAVSEIFG